MKKKSAERLYRDRTYLLAHAEVVIDALFCTVCGLQAEALELIALCQWTVGEFLVEYLMEVTGGA